MIIVANWPLVDKVKAFTTTRKGGVSLPPFDSFNIGDHVGDKTYDKNRQILMTQYQLPSTPYWLNQIHSNVVTEVSSILMKPDADASFTTEKQTVCAVMTADCLPILISHVEATVVGAIHAGWKSLASGIIDQTITKLNVPVDKLLVWLGPAISKQHFEVGKDVLTIFQQNGFNVGSHFEQTAEDKWHADLYGLAKENLTRLGISQIYGGNHCTYAEKDLFYSYRRDKLTGRMASLIWKY